MFTGLIESVGRIRSVEPMAGGQRLTVESDLAAALADGDSVATNGVCLTVVAHDSDTWAADLSPETLRVTALGMLRAGAAVNLERSVAVGSRLGGHFVLGHVDGTGVIERIVPEGEFWRIAVSFPDHLAPYFILKGSVAVDGISLTIASLDAASLDVQIVPHTWTHTALQGARPGDHVNLECDMVGKYVLRAVSLGYPSP